MILMAGPCAIEGKDELYKTAEDLKKIAKNKDIDFYFKASFDKANRTSLENFRGIGMESGLKILRAIKRDFGYKIITDVHETSQIEAISEVADIIQIPALLCRQTDLIVESAKTSAILNIKKGQFMNPKDMQYAVLKAIKTRGGEVANYKTSKKLKIWLTERGSSFGYGNLVVDMRGLAIMRSFAPVIFDCTHSIQMPGGGGGKSSGESEFAPILARAAAAVGVDGFFMECHFEPKIAKSDGANMLKSTQVASFVKNLLSISNLIKELK